MLDAPPLRLPVRALPYSGEPPAWDPAGERLALLTPEGLVLLRVGEAAARRLGGPREAVRCLAWSPDGEALAVANDDRDVQRLLRVSDGGELWRTALGETAIDVLRWSPEGRHLAFLGEGVGVCAADTGALRWRHAEARVQHVPSVSARVEGGRVTVVEQVRREEEPLFPDEIAWSPDGRLLAARWGEHFRVFGADDGALKAGGEAAGTALRWGAGGAGLFEEGENRLCCSRHHIVDRFARTLTWSPDGRSLAAEGDKHCLWIEDATGLRALAGHPRTITGMAWSRAGRLATTCRDGVLRTLAPGGDTLVAWAQIGAEQGDLSWSPDGARLAVSCGEAVFVLSLEG